MSTTGGNGVIILSSTPDSGILAANGSITNSTI